MIARLVHRHRQIQDRLKSESHYWQTGYYGLWLAAITHGIFLITFFVLKVWPLVWINIGSVAIYLYAIYGYGLRTLRTGDDRIIGWLVFVELIGHNVAASYLLSRHAGFDYYIHTLVALPFFVRTYRFQTYVVRMAAAIGAALWIDISSSFDTLKADISPDVIVWMHHGNLLIFLVVLSALAYLYSINEYRLHQKLQNERNCDPLTGLYNRRYIQEYIERLPENSQWGVLLVDADRFKRINDDYGHECGDDVLKTLSSLLRDIVGKKAIVGRWGGEEIVIVYPDTNKEALIKEGKWIVQAVEATHFRCDEEVEVTVTVGGALRRNDERFDMTMLRADIALYMGKRNGRNQFNLKE